ncbi:MAG: histone H1 [Gammaproteobacteria bacterium]|nr:histone H1 [Gammaproteobacteria bacterium]
MEELITTIKEEFVAFEAEVDAVLKGQGAASRRARKATSNLDKLGKQFRKVTNAK